MIIPKLHYISQGNSPKELIENIHKACTSGAELVQLRLKNISEKKLLKLAEEAREITAHFQTRLIINHYYQIAKSIKADGVHLGNEAGAGIRHRRAEYQLVELVADVVVVGDGLLVAREAVQAPTPRPGHLLCRRCGPRSRSTARMPRCATATAGTRSASTA